MNTQLNLIYKKLYNHFGPQHWWPAESPFEVMVGAILTQNTSWQNVERAIRSLKKNNLLEPKKLYNISTKNLGLFIKSAGYYNIKAKRLKEFLKFYFDAWKGSLEEASLFTTKKLRKDLLSVKGIGQETADSILLYALNRPVFVVDAYTKRIFSKHGLIKENAVYDEVQSLFMLNLKKNVKMFNEYHALLVKLGKEYCLKRKAKCEICPLKKV